MLVAYLRASADQLGYISLPVPLSFSMLDGQHLQNFTPLAGDLKVRPVYTTQLAGGEEVVMKLGSKTDVEREVHAVSFIWPLMCGKWLMHALPIAGVQVSFLKDFGQKEGLPRLRASGALPQEVAPGVSHYLVISPVGQLLGDDSEPDLVQTVFRDIASVIRQLLNLGILHR